MSQYSSNACYSGNAYKPTKICDDIDVTLFELRNFLSKHKHPREINSLVESLQEQVDTLKEEVKILSFRLNISEMKNHLS